MTVMSDCGGAPVVSMTVTCVIARAATAAAAVPANAAASAPHSTANAFMSNSSRSQIDGCRFLQDHGVHGKVYEPQGDPHRSHDFRGAVHLVEHIADHREPRERHHQVFEPCTAPAADHVMMDHGHVQQHESAERSEVHDAREVIEMTRTEDTDDERDTGHEEGAYVRGAIPRMDSGEQGGQFTVARHGVQDARDRR